MSDISDLGNKEIFAKNLSYYLTYYNKNGADVCRDLDISPSTFSDWLNAKKYPRIDKIELLANYFNIQKSDLIENKEKEFFDEFEILFSKNKNLLTDEDKEYIKFIIEKRKREIDKELGENDI